MTAVCQFRESAAIGFAVTNLSSIRPRPVADEAYRPARRGRPPATKRRVALMSKLKTRGAAAWISASLAGVLLCSVSTAALAAPASTKDVQLQAMQRQLDDMRAQLDAMKASG